VVPSVVTVPVSVVVVPSVVTVPVSHCNRDSNC
jgi:hypothetical protein